MADASRPAPSDWLFRRPAPLVVGLVLLYSLIEAVLEGADLGLWGSVLWRPLAYQYGGFWAGLLHGWKPNYSFQPEAMFVTYSFLHAGLTHLAGNMLVLVALANVIGDRLRPRAFLALWVVSTLAGAAAFGLLSPSARPMVGTSGALFGLAGLLVVWEAGAARRNTLWQALGWTLGLVVLNLASWWLDRGNLAWQTHLGGFLAGVAWGLIDKRPRRDIRKRSLRSTGRSA